MQGSPCASELVQQYVTRDKRLDQTPPICFGGGLCVVFIALVSFPPTRLNAIAQSRSAQKALSVVKTPSNHWHATCAASRTGHKGFWEAFPPTAAHTHFHKGRNEICARHKAQRGRARTFTLCSVIAFDVTLTVFEASWGMLGNPCMGNEGAGLSIHFYSTHIQTGQRERKPPKQHFELQSLMGNIRVCLNRSVTLEQILCMSSWVLF